MDLTGNYILFYDREDERYQVLLEKKDSNKEYEVVIRDAGYKKDFALALVSMLNAQGSEVGNVGSTEN